MVFLVSTWDGERCIFISIYEINWETHYFRTCWDLLEFFSIWGIDPVRETPNNPLPKATESDVLSSAGPAQFSGWESWPFLFAVILDFYPKNRTTGCRPKVWKVTSVTLKRKNPSNIWCKTPMDYQTIYQTSPISSHLIHVWGTPHSVLPNTKRPRMKGAFRDVVRHGDHRPLRQIRCSKLDKIFMDCDLSHWRTRSAKHLEV